MQQCSCCYLPVTDTRCACPCDTDVPFVCAGCCYICCGQPQAESRKLGNEWCCTLICCGMVCCGSVPQPKEEDDDAPEEDAPKEPSEEVAKPAPDEAPGEASDGPVQEEAPEEDVHVLVV